MSKNSSGTGSSNGSSRDRASDHNREQQLNDNNDKYWQSRGEESRPTDWEDRTRDGD
ncbi:hypothetical protein [Paraburkholderia phytofirmans]|uniref:hypothetical protein n=1 Tax=Paraburkholderia phytofirmans TaxID=261302 RepID=UPI0038B87C06